MKGAGTKGAGTAYYLYRPWQELKYPPQWRYGGCVYRVDPPVRYKPLGSGEEEAESRFVVGLPLGGGMRALIACDESGMYLAADFLHPMNWQFDEAMLWENGYELLNVEELLEDE